MGLSVDFVLALSRDNKDKKKNNSHQNLPEEKVVEVCNFEHRLYSQNKDQVIHVRVIYLHATNLHLQLPSQKKMMHVKYLQNYNLIFWDPKYSGTYFFGSHLNGIEVLGINIS